MERRVVITGIGPVTPIGIGKENLLQSLEVPFSPSCPIKSFDASKYGNLQACEIPNFNLDDFFLQDIQSEKLDKKTYHKFKSLDKAIQFAAAGTKLALEDSHLEYDKEENSVGIYLGNAEECIQSYEHQVALAFQRIMKKILETFSTIVRPFHYLQARRAFREVKGLLEQEKLGDFIRELHERYGTIHQLAPASTIDFKSYSIPARVASLFSLHGPALAINTSCASGIDAIGQAFRQIQQGYDVMICGGAESPISLESVAALDNLGVISKTKPRPYDRARDGFALGEGAGILVLEELEYAEKRGARIYAEITGYGQACDSSRNILALNPKGTFLEKAIKIAIGDKHDITYINSHGTATQSCDEIETKVFKQVFGKEAGNLFISSTKPMTGHSFGAVGGIEAIITSLAIENSIIPPTMNLENPSPDCDLNYVPNKPIYHEIHSALITSMGFGGFNSALVLKNLLHKGK